MTAAEAIKQLLNGSPDPERAVSLCELVGVGVPARFRNDAEQLTGYLKQALTHPSAYRKEIPDPLTRSAKRVKKTAKPEHKAKPKAVKSTVSPAAVEVEAPEPEPETLVWEFPKHYPPILQQKIITANKLVREKRKLSNQLVGHYPKRQPALVKQILNLSKEIDEIYQGKRDFDKKGVLPKRWLSNVDDKTANQINELDQRVKTLRTYISKQKARLNNPMEVRRMDIKATQEKIDGWEAEKAEIQTKIYQLKLYASEPETA